MKCLLCPKLCPKLSSCRESRQWIWLKPCFFRFEVGTNFAIQRMRREKKNEIQYNTIQYNYNTLVKLFLSLVFVFSSTEAFTEVDYSDPKTTALIERLEAKKEKWFLTRFHFFTAKEITALIEALEIAQNNRSAVRREKIRKAESVVGAFAEALAPPEKLRQEDLKEILRILEVLSHYPYKQVVNAFTRSIEYELMKPRAYELMKPRAPEQLTTKEDKIIKAAMRSLFKVLSHHEAKMYLDVDNWIEGLVRKSGLNNLESLVVAFRELKDHPNLFNFIDLFYIRGDITQTTYYRGGSPQMHVGGTVLHEELLMRISLFPEIIRHPKFYDWAKGQIRAGGSIARHFLDYFAFQPEVWDNPKNLNLIKILLKKRNQNHDYYLAEYLFSQKAIKDHPFFKLLNKELTVYSLRQAINSGEWDKAYTAYIQKMNGETTMQKEIRPLDIVDKEESKLNACKTLFK